MKIEHIFRKCRFITIFGWTVGYVETGCPKHKDWFCYKGFSRTYNDFPGIKWS